MPSPTAAIELRDITKRFPGVIANDRVNLTVAAGSIHAVVGENGSGKSTLMKTLYGAHRPDEGTITVNGVQQQFKSPRDAIHVGIGMVFQHFMLADNFTVWENVVLGQEPGSTMKLDRKGVWLVRLVFMQRCKTDCGEADWESFWGSFSFGVR